MFSIRKLYKFTDKLVWISVISILLLLIAPNAMNASPNDACFLDGCHTSTQPRPIDKALYDSNPHSIINCVDCHNSIVYPDQGHGNFIRQLNGSNITGPLTTKYYSQNFSLCYACHNETRLIGILPDWKYDNTPFGHENPPINVSIIGTNFINLNNQSGYTQNGFYPANIHWNHLDLYGIYPPGWFDSNYDGTVDSRPSCPACHNVHGTKYPKMTKDDIALGYGSDSNGTFGFIGSVNFTYPGGDLYCRSCHASVSDSYKYYRNEINIFDDCVLCHVDNADNINNISLVNRSAFSQGEHININTTGGTGTINNSDCWTCHYQTDMNRSNIWQCKDCHNGAGKPEAPLAPKIRTHVSGAAITNYSCVDCHSKVIVEPGNGISNVTSHYLTKPTISSVNYCDYCHGPNPASPFNATNKTIPAFNHDNSEWNGIATCRTCHSNSSVSADPLANDSSSFHDLTTEFGDAFNGTTMADCFICHVQRSPQFVAAPYPSHDISDYIAEDCRNCHTSGSGTESQKLHSVTASASSGCIACHNSDNTSRFYADTTLFGRHANINTTGGPDNVTDDDCITCHFGTADGSMKMKLGAANYSNTYFCNDCHVSGGRNPAEYANISSPYRKDGLSHGSTNCQWCHIAGDPLSRPLDASLRFHPNGPGGTAAGKNCLTCHYSANLPDLPFHAPGEAHENSLSRCDDACHGTVNNHYLELILDQNTPPIISSLSVTTPVYGGSLVEVQASVRDDMMQIAAAQYQVKKGSTIIKDWTNMTPNDGRFNSLVEVVNASIDTSALLGTYNIYVKGMASAPKSGGGPYYPLNGQWSGIINTQFVVQQPEGYGNGTVYGYLGVHLSGAIVTTDTGIFTTTNETGFYSLSLTNGTYHLTATREPEYYPNSTVVVTVTAFTNVTQDIILTPKPIGSISGMVTNK
ncbi:MAG: NapC/NirT family cytochrome c [Candidatus Methanoperedens sp.]|nr:NapC/NirT family cytochrome c [Candidatus Methanoperedens sp.]